MPRSLPRGASVVALASLAIPAHALRAQSSVAPLRTEPVERVVADLDTVIPARLADAGVPGLAIALIRDGVAVWTKGYGIANTMTRTRVDATTVFSAASNGKPVVAYGALRMVATGRLALDSPLVTYLEERWVDAQGDPITLRHVLNHTSGLSNYLQDRARRPRFPPGDRFSYSGVGFMYLQRVLERVAGEKIDPAIRHLVFDPLGMTAASFVDRRPPAATLARGHIPLGVALAPFAIPFLPALLLTLGLALILARAATGRWRPHWVLGVGAVATAGAAALAFLWWKAGGGPMPVFFGVCFVAFSVLWLGLTTAAVRLLGVLVPGVRRPSLRAGAALVLGAVALATLLSLLRPVLVPLPQWFPRDGNAASSLRATALDLARFMIEVAEPRLLPRDLALALRESTVPAGGEELWGLGIGLRRTPQGDALFHRGSNPGSKSLMVIYPEVRVGVVVLTNGAEGDPVAAAVVERAIGGGRWR